MQQELEFIRKEHIRQRQLEDFISSRKLVRPNTKKWHVVLALIGFLALVVALVVTAIVIRASLICKILLVFFGVALTIELYLRFCLIQAVKCYQHYASEKTRRKCLCVPSCSEYAILCLRRFFPLIIALAKIRKRYYKTCKGGKYKLDFPSQKMNEEFIKTHFSEQF